MQGSREHLSFRASQKALIAPHHSWERLRSRCPHKLERSESCLVHSFLAVLKQNYSVN